ncbi:MAG: hypothetical protein IJA07_11005 [Agathobacter sp.]|nr:hypothetical protein [Agathobacter sp.]
MAISPILNSGMIQRTDDVAALKLQQDNRPMVEQQSAQTQMTRKADEFRHQVVTPADSNKADTHADAREEGKNKYFFQKKTNKKQEEKQEDRVVRKYSSGSFDMKV